MSQGKPTLENFFLLLFSIHLLWLLPVHCHQCHNWSPSAFLPLPHWQQIFILKDKNSSKNRLWYLLKNFIVSLLYQKWIFLKFQAVNIHISSCFRRFNQDPSIIYIVILEIPFHVFFPPSFCLFSKNGFTFLQFACVDCPIAPQMHLLHVYKSLVRSKALLHSNFIVWQGYFIGNDAFFHHEVHNTYFSALTLATIWSSMLSHSSRGPTHVQIY